MQLEIGSIIGDYQVVGAPAEGGSVYSVRRAGSDRVETLTVLVPDLAGAAQPADGFLSDVKLLAGLEHPNIAAVRTALRVENRLFLVTEIAGGETLERKLGKGPLAASEALEYTSQALAALSYAHQRGLIHGDIRPANLAVTPQGAVKLLHFGVARTAAVHQLALPGSGTVSPHYMAPEQVREPAAADARSDLYSLGVTLYELVAGKRPFEGAGQAEDKPVPPASVDPRLPKNLSDLILVAIARDPKRRFQTADAFRNALASVQKEVGRPAPAVPQRPVQAAAAAPAGSPKTAAVARKSHRGLWLAAGALCMALAAVALIQFGPWKKAVAVGTPEVAPEEIAVPAAEPAPEAAPAPAELEPPAAPLEQAAPQVAETPAVTRRQAPARVPPPAAPAQAAEPAPAQTVLEQQPPPAAPAPSGPSESEIAARRAELQQVREALVLLAARFNASSKSLQNIQRSQAASGLGMRADITEAASLAKSFLDGAHAALNADDAASARGLMEKAERQVATIERFLGR